MSVGRLLMIPRLENYRYDAFGKPTIYNSTSQPVNASTVGNRFLFTGREYVSQFGIYEYRKRAYHPGLGRFMSEDPKLFDAGDYNLFRYCGNDPIDHTDPTGEFIDTILDAGFIAYDIYQLVTDSSNRSENWVALGLDTGAAFLPGVTGAGAVYRSGRALQKGEKAFRELKNAKQLTAARKAKDPLQNIEEMMKRNEKMIREARKAEAQGHEGHRRRLYDQNKGTKQKDKAAIEQERRQANEQLREKETPKNTPSDARTHEPPPAGPRNEGSPADHSGGQSTSDPNRHFDNG